MNATVPTDDIDSELRDVRSAVSIRESVGDSDTAQFIADALHEIHVFLIKHGIEPEGPPFSTVRQTSTGIVDVEVGWPVHRPISGTGRIHCGTAPHERHTMKSPRPGYSDPSWYSSPLGQFTASSLD